MTTIVASGTLYIQDTGSGNIHYSTDNSSWTSISSWPVTIINMGVTNLLTVLFTTDIEINNSNSDGISRYFICGSENIQFGSRTLGVGGIKRNITISDVTNYPGLISNKDSTYNKIYVCNLNVVSNSSTLANQAGWVGQYQYGNNSTNTGSGVSDNYFINCSSNGDISQDGGGILGRNAKGFDIDNPINIINCSSSGNIGVDSGGIVGSGSEYISCNQCYNTSVSISQGAGGIFGQVVSNSSATKCYSTATNQGGGGIFGTGVVISTANNCYSTGDIGAGSGGIFGFGTNNCVATNCYSSGTIIDTGTGIFGSSGTNNTTTNCYAAEGNWTNSTANEHLVGTPSGLNQVGLVWIYKGINQPYELLQMGYTPYSLTNIDENYQIVRQFSQTVQAGQSSAPAVVTNSSFSIIPTGNEADITINPSNGTIITTPNTPPGAYTLYIRSTGSYNITQFNLTVEGSPTTTTCCSAPTPIPTTRLPYDTRLDNVIGDILTTNKQVGPGPKYASYADYIRTLKARCI